MKRLVVFVLFSVCATFAAPPDVKVFTKDVVMEKSLKVLGVGTNGDIDILEVDHNSNLKGKVRVGKDLHVMLNADVQQDLTVHQDLMVNQGASVQQNVDVGADLAVGGLSTFGGNILTTVLGFLSSYLGDVTIRVRKGSDPLDIIKYEKLTGHTTFTVDSADAISVSASKKRSVGNHKRGFSNPGPMSFYSTNAGTEYDLSNTGETTMKRRSAGKCALVLEEHQDNLDTTHPLIVVKGKSAFNDRVVVSNPPLRKRLVGPLLVVEGNVEVMGTIDSPGNIKDYEAVGSVQAISGNLTAGDVFSATASCAGNKKATGGGCTIEGVETFGLVLRKANPFGDAMQCEYMEVFADANGIDATIFATVFCVTSV